jgi:hypothetical protein
METNQQHKTHWKKLHNPDYLGAYSLDLNGKYIELNVLIESVKNEIVEGPDGKKDDCIVAKLKGQKPMILNATNCKTLTKLFSSPHIEDWYNKTVTVYVAKIKAFGDVHDALRIKTTLPVVELPEFTPKHERWKGAVTALKAKNTTIAEIRKNFSLSDVNEAILKAEAGL